MQRQKRGGSSFLGILMVFLGIWDMDGITLEIICHQLIRIDMITSCYVDIGIPGWSEDAS